MDISNCNLVPVNLSLRSLLDSFPFLETLDLSRNPLKNLQPLESATNLKELLLQSIVSGLQDGGRLLTVNNWATSLIALQRVDLTENHLGRGDLELVGASNIRSLLFADCQLDNADLSFFLISLKTYEFEELDLSCNYIGDDGSKALSNSFGRQDSLRFLSLTFNNLGR